MILQNSIITSDTAETIALRALAYVVGRDTALKQLIAQTGVAPSSLHERASDPALLAGVLDFLFSNETFLVDFCEIEGFSPDNLDHVRQALSGAPTDW